MAMHSLRRHFHFSREKTLPKPEPHPQLQSLFEPEHQVNASTGSFADTPSEIIQLIASWLPLSSAAAFTLCNHRLHTIIGNQYLLALRLNMPVAPKVDYRRMSEVMTEREAFLQTLDRDMKASFFCTYCSKLHVLAKDPTQNLSGGEIFQCVSNIRCSPLVWYDTMTKRKFHPGFTREHFQMAMKLHQHGLVCETKAYLELLCLSRPTRCDMILFRYNLAFYVLEPRIVDNQMHIRTQSWIFIPYQLDVTFAQMEFSETYHRDVLRGDASFKDHLYQTCACKLRHLIDHEAPCSDCQDLICCRYCPTELHVLATRLPIASRGSLLTITKWQALRPSPSLHQPDRHSLLAAMSYHCRHDEISRAPGSIQAAFENQPGTRFDSILTAEDAQTLLKTTDWDWCARLWSRIRRRRTRAPEFML